VVKRLRSNEKRTGGLVLPRDLNMGLVLRCLAPRGRQKRGGRKRRRIMYENQRQRMCAHESQSTAFPAPHRDDLTRPRSWNRVACAQAYRGAFAPAGWPIRLNKYA